MPGRDATTLVPYPPNKEALVVRLMVLLVICPVAAITGIGWLVRGSGQELFLGALLLVLAVGWFAADVARHTEPS